MIGRNLSFSQIKAWLECRRAWAYKFREGYRPTKPKIEFTRGTLIHLGMQHKVEADLAGGPHLDTWWEKVLREWYEEWRPILGDDMIVDPGWFDGCRFIVEKAAEEFHRRWEVVEDDKGPMLERRQYATIPHFKGLVYICDVVAKRRLVLDDNGQPDGYEGSIWSVDYKTFGKPKESTYGDFDLQGAIYQRGLVESGVPAIGSCLFQIVQEPPKDPRVNKDGSLHATDVKMREAWKPITGELLTYRGAEFLDGMHNQVVLAAAREMAEAENADFSDFTPHVDFYTCRFCEFREPCQARLKGHDEAAILAEAYTQRQRR